MGLYANCTALIISREALQKTKIEYAEQGPGAKCATPGLEIAFVSKGLFFLYRTSQIPTDV